MLQIDQLTMQFGGLTAVSKVDLRVERGQVFSIIGPNGAGKTTVFNAITGIYEPTAGTIKFEGHQLRRAATWRVWLLAAMVGLLTGLAAAAISVNVDYLWRAVVKQNYNFADKQFDYPGAVRSFKLYLAGALRVEKYRTAWVVVDSEGQTVLGPQANRRTREDAELLRDDVETLIDHDEPIAVTPREGKFAILSADSQRTLVAYTNENIADQTVDTLAAVRGDQRARKVGLWLSLLLGTTLGTAGTFAVWNRARRTPDVIALAGIARTFQNIRLFGEMTVLENVLVALDRRHSRNPLRWFVRTPAANREEEAMNATAFESLRFVGLENKSGAISSSLAYGDQRRMEIARALATEPKLLLLDEPAAGMNPAETGELTKLIRRIRERGITVLLIEHHMNVVMGISDRIAVLDYGQKIAEGTPEEIRRDPKVIEAYLGKEEA